MPAQKLDNDSLQDATESIVKSPNGTPSNDVTVSAQMEHINSTDGITIETIETGKIDTENSSPALLPEADLAKEQTLLGDVSIEKVIGEISYSECSDEPQQDMTLRDIPPNLSSMQPIKTSSVVSELPEFSQTPETTLTNSSNGLSPPQESTMNDTSNKELSGSNSTGNGDTSQNKRDCLKSCIIRLTELSSKECDRWMTSSSFFVVFFNNNSLFSYVCTMIRCIVLFIFYFCYDENEMQYKSEDCPS